MKWLILTAILGLSVTITFGQKNSHQKVFTSDVDQFWMAYDSIQLTTDSIKQLQLIQTLYIDKGTEGLKSFMELRDYSAEHWVSLIRKYPKFWNSIRLNTLAVKQKTTEIEKSISRFKLLYPQLKEAKMYFTVGGLRSGGTTNGNMVLIGTEIATGNATTDVSEFQSKWLAGVFKEQSAENIIPLNIHEYVHTQQKGQSENLLAQSIQEGACDFITELVINKPMQTNYINYGLIHEQELKESFKEVMFTTAFNKWLYNGSDAETVADLGYFMGYRICKSYYMQAADKKKAIREIIELNYSNSKEVELFLSKSAYYPEPLNKKLLIESFRSRQPYIEKLEPFANGASSIDTSIKEITIYFSKPMKHSLSIDMSEKGKDFYPITGVAGFSADNKSLTLKINLKAGKEYEFILTDRSFISEDGYPINIYPVKFSTK